MANGNIFTPHIETQAVEPAVSRPVEDKTTAMAIEGLAPFASVGAQVGLAMKAKSDLDDQFKGIQSDLHGLDQKFVSISQAAQSGVNKQRLQLRARTELKSAISNNPIINDQAQALYSKYFGGPATGGAGAGTGASGAFSLTPQETAAKELQAKVSKYTLLKMSKDKAIEAVRAEAQGEIAKVQADKLANEDKVGMHQIAPVTDGILNSWASQGQTELLTQLHDKGPLSPQDRVEFNRRIDAEALSTKRRMREAYTNKDGTYSISADDAQKIDDRVDKQAQSLKSMAEDSTSLKVLTDTNNIANARVNLGVIHNFPQTLMLKKALGEQAFNSYIQALSSSNKTLVNYLKAQYPEFSDLIGKEYNFTEGLSITGTAKMFNTDEAKPMTRAEHIAVGHGMATNANLAMHILDKANDSDLKKVAKAHPASLISTTTGATKFVRDTSKKAQSSVSSMQLGALEHFEEDFRDKFNEFPSHLKITVQSEQRPDKDKNPYGYYMSRPQKRILVSSLDGKDIPQSMVNSVADIYRSIEANPESLPKKLRDLNLSTADKATLWINAGMNLNNLPDLKALEAEQENFPNPKNIIESMAERSPIPATVSASVNP